MPTPRPVVLALLAGAAAGFVATPRRVGALILAGDATRPSMMSRLQHNLQGGYLLSLERGSRNLEDEEDVAIDGAAGQCGAGDPYAPGVAEKYRLASSSDTDGFDESADAVGPGIYGGSVQRDASGTVLIGAQHENHNHRPGPLYDGNGYSLMARAIHAGPEKVTQLLSDFPQLVEEAATGGARPLHICGMSPKGQACAQTLIDAGANVHAADTYGYMLQPPRIVDWADLVDFPRWTTTSCPGIRALRAISASGARRTTGIVAYKPRCIVDCPLQVWRRALAVPRNAAINSIWGITNSFHHRRTTLPLQTLIRAPQFWRCGDSGCCPALASPRSPPVPIFVAIRARLQMAPLTGCGRGAWASAFGRARSSRRRSARSFAAAVRRRRPRQPSGGAREARRSRGSGGCGRGRGGGAMWRLLWVICGRKSRAKQKNFFRGSVDLDELEGDEINAYLCNGGDSDPAETTVGKLSIS